MARKSNTAVKQIEETFVPEFADLDGVPTAELDPIEFSDGSTDWEAETEELEFEAKDTSKDALKELGFDRTDETSVQIVCNINGINVADACKIDVKPNPKRAGSKAFARYALYESAKTVGEYLRNGGIKADLRYDQSKGHLVILEKVLDGHIVSATK